jgi:mannosyltransferase
VGIWAIPKTYDLTHKSNASDLGAAASPLLHPGDLVISMQPEQTPLIDYHLPPKLRYATPMGAVKNPRVMDWTDSQDRLQSATTARNLDPLLANLPPHGRVLLVHPVTTSVDDWDAPWTQLVRRRSAQWGEALARNTGFRRVKVVPPFYRRATRIGIRGVLYEKTG